jgi:hypothetical protein
MRKGKTIKERQLVGAKQWILISFTEIPRWLLLPALCCGTTQKVEYIEVVIKFSNFQGPQTKPYHSNKFVIQKTFGEVKNTIFGYNTDIIRK